MDTLRIFDVVFQLTGIILAITTHCHAATTPRRVDVLVWYANETAPDQVEMENFTTVLGWLDSSGEQNAMHAASCIRKDLELMHAVVDGEQASIEKCTRRGGVAGAVIFTNRLARAGKCRFLNPGSSEFEDCKFSVPATDNYVLNSNVLCREAVLQAALEKAAQLYDPREYRFVLITKSHGSPGLALTTKLPRRHEEIDRDLLLRAMRGEAVPKQMGKPVGITKPEYFAILKRAGQKLGMKFPLVLMESCHGTFADGQHCGLPTNVDRLFSSGDRYMQYATLNYADLFGSVDKTHSFADALTNFLSPRYLALYHTRSYLGASSLAVCLILLFVGHMTHWRAVLWGRLSRSCESRVPAAESCW